MVKKIYAWCCGILCTLWTVGLGATAISRFQYGHENQKLYWDFVLPYNDIVHYISSVPLLPILFLLTVWSCKKTRRRYWPAVLLFIFASVYWLVYMNMYIRWTEVWP
jgi:hypothetical protein